MSNHSQVEEKKTEVKKYPELWVTCWEEEQQEEKG